MKIKAIISTATIGIMLLACTDKADTAFTINEKGYFEERGVSVLVHNNNPTGGYEHEEIIMQGGQPKRDVWIHALYRQHGKTGELFLDGKLIGKNTNMPILSDIFGEAPANCWIGRAPFRGDKFLTNSQVADFRIDNYSVTDKELQALLKNKGLLK